ncbi:hypothetical protein EPN16_04665 [bacterium]|nr:MAG: hypothetical protein EPN16_04665 [bacterium]
MRKLFYCLLALIAVSFMANIVVAQEHPAATHEHPAATHEHSAEHPAAKETLSAGAIVQAIKDHISAVTSANSGYYPLTDTEGGKDLKLTLVKVHEDKVSYIKKEGAYFACADFTAEGGAAYDVDFLMKKNPEGKLELYQAKIHMKDSAPRFTYQDDEITPVE